MTDELVTERLALRRLRPADLDALTGLFADPSFSWHPFRRARSAQEAEAFLTTALEHWRRHGFGRWAVCERAGGRLIGYAGATQASWPPSVRGWDIGWRLASHARGRGLGGEAAKAIVADSFARGAHTLVAVVESGNDPSLRVCRSLGMHDTGTRVHPAFGTPHTVFVLYHPAPSAFAGGEPAKARRPRPADRPAG